MTSKSVYYNVFGVPQLGAFLEYLPAKQNTFGL